LFFLLVVVFIFPKAFCPEGTKRLPWLCYLGICFVFGWFVL
jgi:hypothetical protein